MQLVALPRGADEGGDWSERTERVSSVVAEIALAEQRAERRESRAFMFLFSGWDLYYGTNANSGLLSNTQMTSSV